MKRTVLSRVKFLMLAAIVAIIGMTVVSCSSTTEERRLDETSNYSVTATFRGGGFSDEELRALQALADARFSELDIKLQNITEDLATRIFDAGVEATKSDLNKKDWSAMDQTLYCTMILKDKKSGDIIKIRTLKVTSTGVSE